MRIRYTFAALAIAFAATGCTVAPIQNVDQAPVLSSAGKPLTQEQVRASIMRAGAALGWQMREERPGLMVGTIALRKHSAVVEIPFSATSYSIKYRSSEGLDQAGNSIHKNYNGWVQNLNRGIVAQLALS